MFQKIFPCVGAVALTLALGGCKLATVGLVGPGGVYGTGQSAYYHCRKNVVGSAATEFHALETQIVNTWPVPARVTGGLLGTVEIPPGGWIRDCVDTAGRFQAVQYIAVGTKPNQDGRYASDSWTAQTGWENGNINRTVWHIR